MIVRDGKRDDDPPMSRILRSAVISLLLCPAAVFGQQVVTFVADGPVFLHPNAQLEPLTVAGKDSTADVEAIEGTWTRISFVDSRGWTRVGWVESKFVTLLQPASVSANSAATQAQALSAHGKPSASVGRTPKQSPTPTRVATAPAKNNGRYVLSVTILDRRSSETSYHYVSPATATTTSTSNANCSGNATTYIPTTRYVPLRTNLSVNCYGSGTTQTVIRPSVAYGYDVTGATFTLRLPDGRRAVVNCDSKYALKGDYINQRSCRTPPQDNITVEFQEDKAKLIWPVSIDGKKNQSETYKIIAILPPT
jgi:hypothetical protein